MASPKDLVLQILSEGRIQVDEAAVLLAAVVDRPTMRVSGLTTPQEAAPAEESAPVSLSTAWTGTTRDFLPVSLSTAWSGTFNQVM
jgi:hypothetical protein